MSKTERRKLFQPIPLSAILDPTYQSPFSKLEQFQLDMDISSNCKRKPQPTVWQKLQSSLLSAMSNFIVMSQPVFASSTVSALSQRSTHSMSLVPLKSYSPCELLLHEEIATQGAVSDGTNELQQKPSSLYHSVRSGLQCLRYLATHPVQSEDNNPKQITQTLTPTRHHYNCRKPNSIVFPEVGYSIVGRGALFCPFPSTIDCTSRYSLSAPPSPSHVYQQTSNFVASNLFSWAMSGLLLTNTPQNRHLNTLYKNYCLFSPIHGKGAEINSARLSTQKSPENMESMSTPHASKVEGNIEIFIHSSSTISQDNEKAINCLSTSPTKGMSTTNSNNSTISSGIESSGCIRIETNWTPFNDENSNRSGSSITNFHTVSVCSSSPALKGGTLKFSCSSTMSSSPRAIMSSGRTTAIRHPTESESSTDSYVEFSASVESTDSFCIVFESAAGGCIDEDFDNEDEEWEEDDDDDSDDGGEDQIFNYSTDVSDDIFVDGYIFQADGLDEGVLTCDQVDCGSTIPKKRNKAKTVSFDEEHLVTILEFEDDSESKSSREMYWEMLARDRSRFQDRVFRTGDILEPILSSAHRQKIFEQRFLQAEI